MRTSPPQLQHRVLKLCHDLSHYLLQPCLTRNSASHPTNSRRSIHFVTPLRLCHHHHTTLSFSLIVTRGCITIPIQDGQMGPRRIRLLCSFAVSILSLHQLFQLILQHEMLCDALVSVPQLSGVMLILVADLSNCVRRILHCLH